MTNWQLHSSATAANPSIFESTYILLSKYQVNNKAEVFAFIDENPFLLPLLLETQKKIEVYFRNSLVYLEMETDPELAPEPRLLAIISPSCPPEEAFAKFSLFSREWWLDTAMTRTQNKLHIRVEYR